MGQVHHIKRTPHKDQRSKLFSYYMIAIGLSAPLFTLPQLIKLWSEKDASGLSLITWVAYSIFAGSWLYYGLHYKEKPIYITQLFLFPIDLLVVIGIILYS